MQIITQSDSSSTNTTIRSTKQRAIVAGVALVLGGTLAGMAGAQQKVPAISLATPTREAISPADDEAGEVIVGSKRRALVNEAGMSVPLPAPGTVSRMVSAKPTLTLDFKDVAVSELVAMIAKEGNVGIIVTDDVTKVLKHISFSNKTPEEAIKMVARIAGYAWSKIDDQTFAVSASKSGLAMLEDSADSAPEPRAVPKPAPSIPEPDDWGSMNDEPPIQSIRSAGRSGSTSIPRLERIIRGRSESTYAYIRARNVAPHILAYWIAPALYPEPKEFTQGRELERLLNSPYKAVPAIDPNLSAIQNGFAQPSAGRWSGAASAAAGGYGQFSGGVQTRVSSQVNPFLQQQQQLTPQQLQQLLQQQQQNGIGPNGLPNGFPNNNAAGGGGTFFELPEGVESMISIDAQSSLLVRGTPEGIAELERVIALLDRPLRQVEIEAQFVSLSTGLSKTFGIDFTSANGPFSVASTGRAVGTGITIGFLRNNFRALLGALESTNQAKRVTAPRVTAINNTLATIGTTVSTPFVTTTTTTPVGGQTQTAQTTSYVSTVTGLSVTPTINGDDTVTFRLQPRLEAQDLSAVAGQAPTITSQNVDTLVNVKDGDTIALGGLRTKVVTTTSNNVPILSKLPILGGLFRGKTRVSADGDLIVFVTARIIRRTEAAVPGA